MRQRSAMRGFTLLELLVAVALMSIVVVGVSTTFQGMLRLYGDVRDSRQDAMQIRLLLSLMGDDLRTVSREDTFWGRVPSSMEENVAMLEFTGSISVHQEKSGPQWSDVRVSYRLTPTLDTDDKTFTLIRTERPFPSISGGWRDEAMPVLENIEQLRFYYENAQGVEQEVLLVQPRGAFPRSVRMDLVLRRGQRQESYTARFPLRVEN